MGHFLPWVISVLQSAFRIESANTSSSGNFFGLAQFLSTLALLVVVFNVSDFRFRYRIAVRRYDIRRVGIAISGFIAVALLMTELWFNNGLSIFHFMNNKDNIELLLASIFVALVLYVVCACYVWPARFRASNAKLFFNSTTFYIHQGNKERLQAIAEELNRSLGDIFSARSSIDGESTNVASDYQIIAHNLLLALADNRFCALIVDRVPAFTLRCFELAHQNPTAPFANFSRNIGEEFITNKQSAFYQEEGGHQSGYFGYLKPITNTIFGNFSLIERCASQLHSPLDLHFKTIMDLDAEQADGFARAGIAFLHSYLSETKGTTHSYALARLIDSYKNCISSLYRINNSPGDHWLSAEYARLTAVMQFISTALRLLEEHKIKPRSKKPSSEIYHDTYDSLATLIYDVILASSYVSAPPALSWSVQHNLVWRRIFSHENNSTLTAIRYKEAPFIRGHQIYGPCSELCRSANPRVLPECSGSERESPSISTARRGRSPNLCGQMD